MDKRKRTFFAEISLLKKLDRAIFSSKNNRGLALLYVLGALLITTFIGAALVKLSHHDIISATDYSAMTTAAITARSAMQAAVAKFEQQSQTTVDILNNYRDDAYTEPDKGWLAGLASDPVVLNNQQKFNARILGFDKDNFIVQVEGIGWGKGGSMKKVVGVYNLAGIEFQDQLVPGVANQKSIFLAGEASFHQPVTYTGALFSKNNVTFSNLATGTVFQGPFVCMGNAKFIGGYTFEDVAYFNGIFEIAMSTVAPLVGITFEKKSGFENKVKEGTNYTQTTIDMYDSTFFNNAFYNSDAEIDDMHNNDFTHSGSAQTGQVHNYSSIINHGETIDIKSELLVCVMETDDEPQFNVGAILPTTKIMKWSDVKNTGFGPGLVPYTLPGGLHHTGLTGNFANAIWNYANSVGKLWEGYAVVRVDVGTSILPYTNYGTFTERIIFINDEVIQTSGAANVGWYDCSNTSITVIYNRADLCWGQSVSDDDTFRGYIYNDPSSTSFFAGWAADSHLNRVVGAIHNLNTDATHFYPDGTNPNTNIEYNLGIVDELVSIGLVSNIGSSVSCEVEVQGIDILQLVNPAIGINATELGLCF